VDTKGKNNPFYGKKHSEESLKKMRNPDRELQAAKYKAKGIYYGLLHRLKRYKKTDRTCNILGYTSTDLRIHIELQWKDEMTWDNYGRGGWHIDHIQPINTFPIGTDPGVVNALSNLRPLWEYENLRRPKDGSDL